MSLPTLLFVHAHPDDEGFFGGGAAAHYATLGHRVVLVTCTSGQLGFDPAGRDGSEPGHDDDATRAVRAAELSRATRALQFSRVVTLGYDDSGMAGWSANENPNAFMNVDVDAAAATLAALMREERAAVVVTYDEHGFYGHPDHVMAHRVTRLAIERASCVERLYYPVVPELVVHKVREGAARLNVALPAWIAGETNLVADDLVATTLDVAEVARAKRDAMVAHASQIDNAEMLAMSDDLFTLLFGTEYFQRGWSRTTPTDDEHDLVGGLS